MKKTTLLISVVLMFFILLGAVSATELTNVTSTEASNLITNDDTLSLNDFEDNNDNSILNKELNSTDAIQSDNANKEPVSSSDVPTAKVNTTIDTYNTHYSQSGTVIKIVLKDANGNALENQNVTLALNSKAYTSTTHGYGIAYFNTPTLNQGKYTIAVKYNGDSEHNKCVVSTQIKVLSSISASDLKISYKDGKKYTATFFTETAYLKNTNVKITINSKTYTVKTNSNGIAKISTTGLMPGTYKVKLYNPYTKETVTRTITVNKADTQFIAANKHILPNTKSSYSVILKNDKNEPFVNVNVYFKFNNQQ